MICKIFQSSDERERDEADLQQVKKFVQFVVDCWIYKIGKWYLVRVSMASFASQPINFTTKGPSKLPSNLFPQSYRLAHSAHSAKCNTFNVYNICLRSRPLSPDVTC